MDSSDNTRQTTKRLMEGQRPRCPLRERQRTPWTASLQRMTMGATNQAPDGGTASSLSASRTATDAVDGVPPADNNGSD